MLPDCFDCKYNGLGHPCRTNAGTFDFEKVAAAIVAHARALEVAEETGGDPVIGEDIAWVGDCEYEMIEDHPHLLVPLIVAAMDACATPGQAGFLAAGLVENALVKHGPKIIAPLESLAAGNPKARLILSGVWSQNGSIGKDVWERLAAVVAAGPVMSVDDERNPGFGLPQERLIQEADVTNVLASRVTSTPGV